MKKIYSYMAIVMMLIMVCLMISGCKSSEEKALSALSDALDSITEPASDADAANDDTADSVTEDKEVPSKNLDAAYYDISDESIEAIVTYNDYLLMYERILANYLHDYYELLSAYGLDSGETDEEYKNEQQSTQEKLQSEQESYGSYGNKKLSSMERGVYVSTLKTLRSTYKSMIKYEKSYLDMYKGIEKWTEDMYSDLEKAWGV